VYEKINCARVVFFARRRVRLAFVSRIGRAAYSCLGEYIRTALFCQKCDVYFVRKVRCMREIYDRLTESVPADIRVDFVAAGVNMTMADIGGAAGLAQTLAGDHRPGTMDDGLAGKPLRDVVSLLGSWNYTEASMGLAALCAWYNTAAPESGVPGSFRFLKRLTENRRVAMTCDACYLTQWVRSAAQLSIFAETPAAGSYPMLASEYLMSQQDMLLLSGDAFITKRLPRLLELSASSCETILVGFGIPMADCLLDCGVDEIAAVCVVDAALCRRLVLEGAEPDRVLSACAIARRKAAV
jgi:uncharacterized protein (DUF4213/DUF364 family)